MLIGVSVNDGASAVEPWLPHEARNDTAQSRRSERFTPSTVSPSYMMATRPTPRERGAFRGTTVRAAGAAALLTG